MNSKLVIRPAASTDIAEAYSWYEAQRAGLGGEFLDAIEEAMARIAHRPLDFPLILGEARRALVRRFPYSIYFRLRREEARIIGVIHQHRDLRVLRGRARRG